MLGKPIPFLFNRLALQFNSLGMQSMLGNMYARKETETLNKTFSWIEWLLHFAVIFTFTCTAILILPFVKVYTADVTDANYFVPAVQFSHPDDNAFSHTA